MVPKKYHSKISGAYNYLKSLYLFGFKHKCIFCNGRFRKFLLEGLKNNVALSLIGEGFVILYVLDAIRRTGRDWFIGI